MPLPTGCLRPLKGLGRPTDTPGDMTTIRTTCPRCGEVDMGPESILLSVQGNGHEGTYRFTCPLCADDVEKRADRKIVALLVSAGVGVSGSEADPGLDEGRDELFDRGVFDEPPEHAPEGPSLSIDDLIDFHFRLENAHTIEEFFAGQ